MSPSRRCLFCLIVSGLLATITLIPLGALEVFEFKTVDVRFWIRERLFGPQPRQFVRSLVFDPQTGASHQVLPGSAPELETVLEVAGPSRVIGWELPGSRTLARGPLEQTFASVLRSAPDSTLQKVVVGIPGTLQDSHLTDLSTSVRRGRLAFGVDYDGVVRRVPLLIEESGGIQPSFVLQLVCAYDRVRFEDIRVDAGKAIELWKGNTLTRRIPIDSRSRLIVNYRGRTAEASWHWDDRIALEQRWERGKPRDRSHEAGVLIVGPGLPDDGGAHSIPLATVAPDLEIVAEAVETILANSYIHRLSSLTQFLITWALLLLGALIMVGLRSWRGVLAGFVLMLGYIVAEKAAFLAGNLWFDFFLPLVALQAGVAVFPVYSYRNRTRRLLNEMRLLRRFDDMVLMNIASGLIVAGRHGMVIRHNPRAAELLGLQGQSLHGRHIRELFAVSPAMLELLGQAMAATKDPAQTKRLPISSRVAMPSSDENEGTVLEMEVALVDPMLLASREHTNLPCYVLTFDDVTKAVQQAQEDQRRARLAAMGEIAAKLGHEIRNSLGGLRLYVENVRDEIKASKSGLRAVEAMVREIEGLYRKIDELREYGHDPQLEITDCDLKELLEEALAYSSRKLGDKHVRAVLECERMPPVQVDRRQLREAFQNLINNAIEAAPEGGRVAITAERTHGGNGTSAGSYCIHIDDNGPGIPPDLKDQVFALFFTTKPDIGTGLGLPMVKKIIESHGGQVSFNCDPENGTRFTVVLPAQACAGEE